MSFASSSCDEACVVARLLDVVTRATTHRLDRALDAAGLHAEIQTHVGKLVSFGEKSPGSLVIGAAIARGGQRSAS